MPPKDLSEIPSVLPSLDLHLQFHAAAAPPSLLLFSSPHPDALTHLAVKSPGEVAPQSLANQPRRRRTHSCME